MQLNKGHKGFSFSKEGPLDMRMDPTSDITAAEVVNTWSEKDLGDIFREYGEEKNWRHLAKTIVEARKNEAIKTTTQLADIIVSAFKGRGKLHPATLIFQALRICVNRELDAVQIALNKAIGKLSPGGRIGVISFHSLEDRIVKNVFKMGSFVSAKSKRSEHAGPLAALRLLTKTPLIATAAEIRKNPRARSAKMRFAEKT